MSDAHDAGFQVTGTVRPGGRTSRTREAVHHAVRELMAMHNGEPPEIPEVAARSGINAATIYRRWRTRDALVLDVAVADVNAASPVPATGDLRTDLLAYTRRLVETFARPGGLGFVNALTTASRDARIGTDRVRELVQPRLDRFQEMLDASGTTELSPLDLVLLILGPAHLGATLGLIEPDHDVAARLVDSVLDVAAGRRLRAAGGG
ncbi:TetR/AcrR family transcriptional regulator [Isoptericola sp. BMS4]|uniref:TetR/AcrR family transcriptional regulator n=1 Tax=Isoptericola sp. BMS4 TaxID=2527875 RepID=UPI0014208DED|nr:TetR/AcrR family transcriptional regulator [Isoptericola sp. BMS4]